MNRMDDLASLTATFDSGLRRNSELFGRHAFRKSLVEVDEAANRSVINISLFEVFMVGLSWLDEEAFKNRKDDVEQALVELLVDQSFLHSVTYSTNSTRQVQQRFETMERAMEAFVA